MICYIYILILDVQPDFPVHFVIVYILATLVVPQGRGVMEIIESALRMCSDSSKTN
jgi:hypothetical protein